MHADLRDRDFQPYQYGSLWTVMDYTYRHSKDSARNPSAGEDWYEEMKLLYPEEVRAPQQKDYVVKMLEFSPHRGPGYLPEYAFDPADLESLK